MITTSGIAPTAAAAEIASAVTDARRSRERLRIVGAGSWLDAGGRVNAERHLTVAPFSGITEYVPGDLVLTALAGTSMREIDRATAANGQWLPLDPIGSPEGTLGATVATASAGPLAHANGGPRDLVLGVECVTGTGDIIRGGGRVTKNVAGFDLTRLMVGSWGTLGVLTEISVRLRARPAVEATLVIPMPDEIDRLRERLASVRAAPLEAMAMELVDRTIATRIQVATETVLLLRVGGNEASVAAQRSTLARKGEVREVPASVWESLRTAEPPGAWTWRMSDLPSRLGDSWAHARALGRSGGWYGMHASVGRGIVRCMCLPAGMADDAPPDDAVNSPEVSELIAAFAASRFTGTTIHERLPHPIWQALTTPEATDPVSRRIRSAFDPDSVLNPGIFGEASP